MYTDFFGFDEKPFRLKPDPRFFYSNATYEKAYSAILSSILERKGFTVLTGEAGVGKTALIRKCVTSLDSSVRFIFFPNSILSFEDILDQLCDELDLPVKAGEYFNKTRILELFLTAQIKTGKIFAVLIDDAQNLETAILDNLQSLSRSPRTRGNLLQFILVGLPELQDKLNSNNDLILCTLEPLKSQEIGKFINQQLSAVGCKKNDLFTLDAIRRIAAYSKGIPRSICALCDSALFIASLSQNRLITLDIVEEAAQNCFLTEGMMLDIWPTDNIGKAENRSTASNAIPAPLSQTAPALGESKAPTRPTTPTVTSAETQQPMAARGENFKADVRASLAHPPRHYRANSLSKIAIAIALLFGSGVLVFHYQAETDFFANTLTVVGNWLSDSPSSRQFKPYSAPVETVAEPVPATTASSTVTPPSNLIPQSSAPSVAVVEIPALGSEPPDAVIVPSKHSRQLSAPSLQTSQQGMFIELKGADSASYSGNNVINFNAPAASTTAIAESRRVDKLLTLASQQLARQQFISPVGDNALDTFRQVLQLRPGYSEALEGIDTIKDHYKRQADAAARSADWEKAQALYETALMVDSEDRFLIDILHQIRQKNYK